MVKFLNTLSKSGDVEDIMWHVNNFIMYDETGSFSSNITNYNIDVAIKEWKKELENANISYNVDESCVYDEHGILNKIKNMIKKIIRKSIFFYIHEINQRQVNFNANIVRSENQQMHIMQYLINVNQQMHITNNELIKRIKKMESANKIDDQWYLAFEDAFRGSEEEILERNKSYMDYFNEGEVVLDIGCGRGETLKLLQSKGVKAKGVDINSKMVELCHEKGLEVKEMDCINALRQEEDESLDGIISIQVVEHLSLQDLLEFVKLSSKKLKKEGLLLLETVNPLTLGVFCYGFYIDPTHKQPIHPAMLRFMMEQEGFKTDPIQFVNEFPREYKLLIDEEMTDTLRNNYEKLNNQIYGYQDYYIIGRRNYDDV